MNTKSSSVRIRGHVFLCRLLAIFGLYLLSFSSNLLAADETSQPKDFRVGFWYLPGYHEQNASGERFGYGYEYMEKIAACMGWNFRYVGFDKSWSQLLDDLEKGEIDILSNATKSPERMRRFDYTDRPIGLSFTILTVKAGDNRYRPNDYAAWDGMRIGMVKESSRNQQFEQFSKNKAFHYVPVIYPTYDDLEVALQRGEVDALVSTNTRRTHNEWILEKINPDPLYIIVRKGNKPLLDAINQALSILEINAPRLSEALTGRYYASENAKTIPLTSEEQNFIDETRKNGKVFRALLKPDRWPLAAYRDGEIKGCFRDIADLLIERSCLNIKVVPCKNRKEYEDILHRGEYDLILDAWANYPYAEKNELYLSEPYLSSSVSILRRKDRDITNGRKATFKNSWLLNELRFRGDDISNYLLCDSMEELISAVMNGSADLAYVHTQMADEAIYQDNSMTLVSQLVYGLQTEYSVGFKRALPPEMIRIVSKAVRSVSDDDVRQVISRYEIEPRKNLSMHDWITANPLKSILFSTIILSAVLVLLIFLLASRRRIYRNGKILAKLPVRFFVADRDHNVLLFNAPDVHAQKTRWSRIDEFNVPDVVDAMKKGIDSAFENGSASVDYIYNGERRTARTEKLPESLFRKETAIWISQNTEELQTSRLEVQNLAERLRLTLSSIGDGVIAADKNGSVTLMNPVAEQLTGWTNQEAKGKNIEEVFCIRDCNRTEKPDSPILTCLREDRIIELANHTDLVAKDGSQRHIANSAAPIHDAFGTLIGAILVFRDVSEEYRHREQLNQALLLAQSAEKAKSYFLATMSHEIRTPLNAVIGFSELLKDSNLSQEQREDYLNDIYSAGNALLLLINDVLDLSKLESEQVKFVSVETDFPQLMHEITAVFKSHSHNKNIALIPQIAPMPHVFIDPLRIRQILFNLIGNAVKFTNHGSITLHAEFSRETKEKGTLVFFIADTGIGISKDDQSSIFEPFVQSRTLRGTQVANSGTGLGLAIVRRMVVKMNGDISLKSEPGQGAIFTVTLRDVLYKEVLKHAIHLPADGKSENTFDTLSGLSILLVDDVALNLKVESAMLQTLGIKAVTATHAAEALAKLEKSSFDFILTDLWMPGLNGMELAQRIRRDHCYDSIRIVAVTADTESQVDFDMTVFDGIVTKPVTLDKLNHLLHSLRKESKK